MGKDDAGNDAESVDADSVDAGWREGPGRASQEVAASFETIYRRELGFIHATVRRLGIPPDQVDDAVQEVFMVLHARLGRLEAGVTLRPWLRSVALRVCLNRRRVHHRRSVRLGSAGAGVDPDSVRCERGLPDESLEQSEALRRFERALRCLSNEQRDVFLLARFEERTLVEIGSLMRISPNTAASRLRVARAHLERACRATRSNQRREPLDPPDPDERREP